jgi:hypothetical protein
MPRLVRRVKEGVQQGLMPTAEQRRSLRRAATLTACFGAAHALLFLASFFLKQQAPGPNSSDEELIEFYSSGASRSLLLVGLYLMPFAAIFFIWFTVALRMWVSGSIRRENILLSNLQLVSGVVYIALFCVAGAANSVVAAGVEFADIETDTEFARQFPLFSDTVLYVFDFRMAAMFVFTTSSIARTADIMPRWFSLAGYAVGLFLLLSASFSPWFALVFPAWLLALSSLLLLRARRIPADVELPARLGRPGGLTRA